MGWLNSVEFYVIAGTAAAAVVALAAVPRRQGPAVLHLVAGELSDSDEEEATPMLDATVDSRGHVILTRTGLRGLRDDGAVSLAVNVIGFDVQIEERITPGRRGLGRADTVCFDLDFFAPERYHISYNSEDTGAFTAFTLPVREGIRISRPLIS